MNYTSLKIRLSVPVERVETAISNSRVENRCFNPLNSYIKSDFQRRRYENSYALLKTKHNGFNEGECSPCFARAANFTLVAIAVFYFSWRVANSFRVESRVDTNGVNDGDCAQESYNPSFLDLLFWTTITFSVAQNKTSTMNFSTLVKATHCFVCFVLLSF